MQGIMSGRVFINAESTSCAETACLPSSTPRREKRKIWWLS